MRKPMHLRRPLRAAAAVFLSLQVLLSALPVISMTALAAETESGQVTAETESGQVTDGTALASGTESGRLTVEYEVLRDLLQAGNFTLKQTKESQADDRKPYEEMKEILLEEAKEMRKTADSYEDDGDTDMQEFYEDRANELEAAASQVGIQLRRLNSSSQDKAYEKQTDSLLVTAQTLMISYKQMEGQIEAREKSAEAAEAALKAAESQYAAGLIKGEEVTEALNSLTDAKNTLASLREQAEELKNQLLTMLGLTDETDVELGEIPEPDLEAIGAIDLESDKTVAVSNDSTYASEITSSVKGSDGRTLRAMRVEDAADTELTSITSTYQALQNKKLLYDAALAAYEAAKSEYDALMRKKEAGLLTNTELLEGEASWLSGKADMEEASMNLFQAYETYCWEVKGRV